MIREAANHPISAEWKERWSLDKRWVVNGNLSAAVACFAVITVTDYGIWFNRVMVLLATGFVYGAWVWHRHR